MTDDLTALEFTPDPETVVSDSAVGLAVARAVILAIGHGDLSIATKVGRLFTLASITGTEGWYDVPPPFDPSSEAVAAILTPDGVLIAAVPTERLV